MAESIIIAARAVVPLFVLIMAGFFVRWRKMLDKEELADLNAVIFRVFFFCLTFSNIYLMQAGGSRTKIALFTALGVTAAFTASWLFVCAVEKRPKERGTMIHCMFRCNFVILGIPLMENLLGSGNLSVPSMMMAIVVPLNNIYGVIAMETFRGKGGFSLKSTLIGIAHNPMLQGIVLGLIFHYLAIPVPDIIMQPVRKMAACTSTLALIVLGASYSANSLTEEKRDLVLTVLGRIVVIPAVMLSLAYHLGFRGVEFVTLLGVFATPTGVVTFTMAQALEGDPDLAGNSVMATSALSCLTLFCFILIFSRLGAI